QPRDGGADSSAPRVRRCRLPCLRPSEDAHRADREVGSAPARAEPRLTRPPLRDYAERTMRTRPLVCPVVVGRDAELERLEIALEDARHGRGALVAVTGEAGVGKTRLVDELSARARQRG